MELKITPIMTLAPPMIWVNVTVSSRRKMKKTIPSTGTRFIKETEALADSFFNP